MSRKIYFKIISEETPSDELNGFVLFENGKAEPRYFDDCWEGDFPKPLAISDKFSARLNGFDIVEHCQLYRENEFGIQIYDNLFTVVINPQDIEESLLNTVIHWNKGFSDSIWVGGLPRRSIRDLLYELCGVWNTYIKEGPCNAYVKWHRKGYVNHKLLKIKYPTPEIGFAVESAISRINDMEMNMGEGG